MNNSRHYLSLTIFQFRDIEEVIACHLSSISLSMFHPKLSVSRRKGYDVTTDRIAAFRVLPSPVYNENNKVANTLWHWHIVVKGFSAKIYLILFVSRLKASFSGHRSHIIDTQGRSIIVTVQLLYFGSSSNRDMFWIFRCPYWIHLPSVRGNGWLLLNM